MSCYPIKLSCMLSYLSLYIGGNKVMNEWDSEKEIIVLKWVLWLLENMQRTAKMSIILLVSHTRTHKNLPGISHYKPSILSDKVSILK